MGSGVEAWSGVGGCGLDGFEISNWAASAARGCLKGKRRASRSDDSALGGGQAGAIWTVRGGRGAMVEGRIPSTVGTGAWGAVS